ncbi:hypothetical protein N7501_008650, partial [Penicillium viridicatum]
ANQDRSTGSQWHHNGSLLNPLQSRLFADRTHNWILYPIEKRKEKKAFQTLQYHGSSSVNHRNSTEQTLGLWIGEFQPWFSLPESSIVFLSFCPFLSHSLSITFIYSLIYQQGQGRKSVRPRISLFVQSVCRLPQFPRFPDYYSLSLITPPRLFPPKAQRPLGNDLKALSLVIFWSPLTSNAELQPSPIYQPPRPPAALTL